MLDWLNRHLSRSGWLTASVILLTFFCWLVFDAFCGPLGMPTESQVIGYWAVHVTGWDFLFGALAGHWFLRRRSANYSLWWIPFAVLAGLFTWDVWWVKTRGWTEASFRSPWIWEFIGMAAGTLCWPQQDSESVVP